MVVATKLGRKFSRTALDITDDPTATAQFYLDLANELRNKQSANLQIFAGGRTCSGKRALANNADATQPAFGIGMDDFDGDQDATHNRYRNDDD